VFLVSGLKGEYKPLQDKTTIPSFQNICMLGVSAMTTGVVKWFNNAKGYGFVTPEDGEQDVFVHFSSIEMDGYKTLKEGQRVQFEINQGPKGLHATNIQNISNE
jgi:CspA family cold shock protein